MKNVCEGAKDSLSDLGPSICSSACGLAQTLWAYNPLNPEALENSKQFAHACRDMCDAIVDYCSNVDETTLNECVDQVKELYKSFDKLSSGEKGELIGYAVGKYGVDLFAGGATVKCVKAYRNLKAANSLCTLETMAIAKTKKKKIIESSLKHTENRQDFFSNVKLLKDKQNKHVVGAHNFDPGKGVFEHPDPQSLLKKFAGKGKSVDDKLLGTPGYKERVDFGEHIGYYANTERPGEKLPTTKGLIHYSKKGAHIVPSDPNGT